MRGEIFRNRLSDKSNINVYRIGILIKQMAEILLEELPYGPVKVSGVGVFELIDVKDRKRYSAAEGRQIMVRNSKRIKFIPCETLMNELNKDKTVEKL